MALLVKIFGLVEFEHQIAVDCGWMLCRIVLTDTARRLALPHLEHTTGRLDLGCGAPSGNECARERRIREIIDAAAKHATGAQEPAVGRQSHRAAHLAGVSGSVAGAPHKAVAP